MTYLRDNKRIELQNHRSQTFYLETEKVATTHKVICYVASPMLPNDCQMQKFHRSSTVGVIHLIPANDYLGIVNTLLTPSELSEYLEFREELAELWNEEVNSVPETAIMGQYLQGNAESRPSLEFVRILAELEHRLDEWDMSGVVSQFPDRIAMKKESTDYCSIVQEIAKLKRNELREFKKRFLLSMKKSRKNVFVKPYRMASFRTRCGFVFVPLDEKLIPNRRQGLQNMTLACKYDLKLDRCLSVSFAPEPDGWYSVEWCYMEFPWEYDKELEERLKISYPFRQVRTIKIGRYNFVGE